MKRSILSIGLAVAALALLGALVLQSRPVSVDVHIAHHAAIADLERTGDDFIALVNSVDTAWANVQMPGAGSRTLATRVTESPARVSEQLLAIEGGASQGRAGGLLDPVLRQQRRPFLRSQIRHFGFQRGAKRQHGDRDLLRAMDAKYSTDASIIREFYDVKKVSRKKADSDAKYAKALTGVVRN